MTLRDRLVELLHAARELEEGFIWSDWSERIQQNALPVMIVLIFLSGLGSCAVFAGKAALSGDGGSQATETKRPAGSSQNPWALDKPLPDSASR